MGGAGKATEGVGVTMKGRGERHNALVGRQKGWEEPGVGATFMAPGQSHRAPENPTTLPNIHGARKTLAPAPARTHITSSQWVFMLIPVIIRTCCEPPAALII